MAAVACFGGVLGETAPLQPLAQPVRRLCRAAKDAQGRVLRGAHGVRVDGGCRGHAVAGTPRAVHRQPTAIGGVVPFMSASITGVTSGKDCTFTLPAISSSRSGF